MPPIKPTITYKLADLLTLAAEMQAGHEAQARASAGQNLKALTNSYHTTMAEGAQRVVEKLEAFRAAGVETVTAEHLIYETGYSAVTNEDTSLSNQLRKNQIRPVMA